MGLYSPRRVYGLICNYQERWLESRCRRPDHQTVLELADLNRALKEVDLTPSERELVYKFRTEPHVEGYKPEDIVAQRFRTTTSDVEHRVWSIAKRISNRLDPDYAAWVPDLNHLNEMPTSEAISRSKPNQSLPDYPDSWNTGHVVGLDKTTLQEPDVVFRVQRKDAKSRGAGPCTIRPLTVEEAAKYPLSHPTRSELVKARSERLTTVQIAERYGVSEDRVRRASRFHFARLPKWSQSVATLTTRAGNLATLVREEGDTSRCQQVSA